MNNGWGGYSILLRIKSNHRKHIETGIGLEKPKILSIGINSNTQLQYDSGLAYIVPV